MGKQLRLTQDDLARMLDLKSRNLIDTYASELFTTENGLPDKRAIRQFEVDTDAKVEPPKGRSSGVIVHKGNTFYWG